MQSNKKLGSYPGILITVSLTVALFLIGFCGWVALSSKEMIRYVKQNIQVQVYLDHDMSQGAKDSLQTQLNQLKELERKVPHNKVIEFISADAAAANFLKETNEDYKEILGNNPFRDAFTIRVKEAHLSDAGLEVLKNKLEALPGVYEVDYAKDFVNGITENANKAYLVLATIVFIFLIATILLINNTIKLALYSQRFIIRTMQLVGATNGFIQKPFITKGLTQGFVAGLIACLLVAITQQLALRQLEGLSLIQNNTMMLIVMAIILILGPMIGVVSTFQSISRYLNIDLDDLY